MNTRELFSQFEVAFETRPTVAVRAPGRVNLIGEHTDYNDGFVLPCAIDLGTTILGCPREGTEIRVVAQNYDGEMSRFFWDVPIETDGQAPWSNYVRGVVDVFKGRGLLKGGADLFISGNIPQGAGLSSSAALEVAVGQMMSNLVGLDLDGIDLAKIGQSAENDFVGCQCGIMDQLASALGQKDHALLIDCRDLNIVPVSMPEDLAILIVNSKVQRGLVDSEYNARRWECMEAAKRLGVASLRDVTMEDLIARKALLSSLLFRRAHHVVSENARTVDAAEALKNQDMGRLGELMAASHSSLDEDYEVTVPPLNILVELIAPIVQGAGGVRMTGGGFGGCIVCVAPQDRVDAIRAAVGAGYTDRTGLVSEVYECVASEGVHSVSLQ